MRDIMALATDVKEWPLAVTYAADLSATLDASLTGVQIKPPPISAHEFVPPSLWAEFNEICRAQAEASLHAVTRFPAWARTQGVASSAWHVADGALLDVVEIAANWHDLIVIEASNDTPWTQMGRILLSIDIPCLVVPSSNEGFRIDSVAVAWNGSPQSVRAVRSALPLLRHAKHVVLIDGSNRESLPPAHEAADIQRYLADCGISTTRIAVETSSTGEEILARSSQASANLLVMGAYGRTRFSEWALGGTTRYALEHATIPLFLHH